jgi:hypothetical protein
VSEAAQEQIKTMRGYAKNCEYIEYFSEEGLKDYAFVTRDHLFPIAEENLLPPKRSRRLDEAMAAAVSEQVMIDSIVDTVASLVRRSTPSMLVGAEWVGTRVRAAAKPFYPTSAPPSTAAAAAAAAAKAAAGGAGGGGGKSAVAAKASGTVAHYCPAINEHLVVFDSADARSRPSERPSHMITGAGLSRFVA